MLGINEEVKTELKDTDRLNQPDHQTDEMNVTPDELEGSPGAIKRVNLRGAEALPVFGLNPLLPLESGVCPPQLQFTDRYESSIKLVRYETDPQGFIQTGPSTSINTYTYES